MHSLMDLLKINPKVILLGSLIALPGCQNKLEKYNISHFEIIKTLEKDKTERTFVKSGEFYTDTVVDYYNKKWERIRFKSINLPNFEKIGFLSVFRKDSVTYKYSLKDSTFVEENNLGIDIYTINGNLEPIKLTEFSATLDLWRNFLGSSDLLKKYQVAEYTPDTERGEKMLDSKKSDVNRYMNAILNHKRNQSSKD